MNFQYNPDLIKDNKLVIAKAINHRVSKLKEVHGTYKKIEDIYGINSSRLIRIGKEDLKDHSLETLMRFLAIIDPSSVSINIKETFIVPQIEVNPEIKKTPMPEDIKDPETHERILKELGAYYFYKVTASGTPLIRYNAFKKPLRYPIRNAIYQLSSIGNSAVSKQKYLEICPSFYEHKERFIHSLHLSSKVLQTSDLWDIIGYVPDFSKSKDVRNAARIVTILLNNKAIAQL